MSQYIKQRDRASYLAHTVTSMSYLASAIEDALDAIVDVASKSAGLQWFGDRLVQKELIAEGLKSEILQQKPDISNAQKVEQLMNSVTAQVKCTSAKYESFLSILEDEAVLRGVARTVRDNCKRLICRGQGEENVGDGIVEDHGEGSTRKHGELEGTAEKQEGGITENQSEGTTEDHREGTPLPRAKFSAGAPTSVSKRKTMGSRKRSIESEPGSGSKAKQQKTGQL